MKSIFPDSSEKPSCQMPQLLSACASHFGYDWGKDTQHDSLSDVKTTLFCFQKLREAGYYGATGSN
ncbi:MAG: hypothetical protein PUE64_03285 [Firmicutes bacterium]|nr:hypothetical protein [Bacillota bacterium]